VTTTVRVSVGDAERVLAVLRKLSYVAGSGGRWSEVWIRRRVGMRAVRADLIGPAPMRRGSCSPPAPPTAISSEGGAGVWSRGVEAREFLPQGSRVRLRSSGRDSRSPSGCRSRTPWSSALSHLVQLDRLVGGGSRYRLGQGKQASAHGRNHTFQVAAASPDRRCVR
jgi:hypothetical protein